MNDSSCSSERTPGGSASESSPLTAEVLRPQPPVTGPVWWHPPPRPARRLLTWLGWLGFLSCGMLLVGQWSARQEYFDVTGGIRERFHSGQEGGQDKVAVITVRGVLLEGDGFVKRQIERVMDDPRVRSRGAR